MMKDKYLNIEFIRLIILILFYHIIKDVNIFIYLLTCSLYNIFLSCFAHISIKEILDGKDNNYKKKLVKYLIVYIIIICMFFVLLSIFIGDLVGTLLNIQYTFLPYFIMGLSLIVEIFLKILLVYMESLGKHRISNNLYYLYYILEAIMLLTISLLCFKINKVPSYIGVSLLYLSKFISFIVILFIIFKLIDFKDNNKNNNNLNIFKDLKIIISKNNYKSLIMVVKNSYFYISIIVLYVVLSSRYSYDVSILESDITFIYLFGLTIINFIKEFLKSFLNKQTNIIKNIYLALDIGLVFAIIMGITSPLICKILFFTSDNSIYLTMLCILLIFILLYDITFEYIKNKKVIYISLFIGILFKILLVIPFINSFYRMGYNLVYGDIISTILGMSLSILVNYIYIKLNNLNEKILDKILKILYDSMILCIILIIMQFIVPIKTDSYFKSIFILLFYIVISLFYLNFRYKERKK